MKIIKTIGAVLGAIIVIGIIYLFFADFGNYKPEVEAAVAEATGRDFKINGDLSIKVLPSPTMSMSDATLANAPWADEASMVEIGDMSVKVGLWSLLSGPILIKDFQFHDVNVLLESNAAGDSNTDFESAAEEPPPEEEAEVSAEPPAVLRNADVSNVTVTMRGPDTDDLVFALESLTVITDDADQQVIVGNAEFINRALTLDGIVTEEQADMNATFGNIRIHSVTQHRGSEADVDLTLSRLTDVGEVLELTDMPAEDLTLSGNVALRGDQLLLNNVTFGVATASLVMNGALGGEAGVADLELTADAPSLAVLGHGLPDIPMTGSASVSLNGTLMQVEPFQANFGESDIAGSFSQDTGASPSLNLQATSSLIDLRPFAEAEPAEGEAEAEDTGPYVFTEDPLPFDMLQALNADVDVKIDRVQGRTSHFNNVAVLMDADNGDITFENSFEGGRGGNFTNAVNLRASETNADMTINATASDLKLGAFSGEEVPDELVPATQLNLDIVASGASQRQLASSANGRLLFTQGPGKIKNELIGMLSGDLFAQLFSALNPLAEQEQFSNWDCSIFAIDFESGDGEIAGFLLQGEKLMVVGGGRVDLNTEKLNIEFNTKPRAGVGVSADMFVTPFVKLGGTLAEPGVGLNKKGLLLEGGLAVATGGLSFLYKGVVDRATAEAGQCEKVMEEINKG